MPCCCFDAVVRQAFDKKVQQVVEVKVSTTVCSVSTKRCIPSTSAASRLLIRLMGAGIQRDSLRSAGKYNEACLHGGNSPLSRSNLKYVF